MGDIGVLPVELAHFSGWPEERSNRLQWTTASETGTARFVIERGTDPDGFLPIGSVTALGESQSLVEYGFTDIDPPAGLAYYRLRIEDVDGGVQESPVITILRDRIIQGLVAAPKPTSDQLHVIWTEAAEVIELVDAAGRTHLRRTVSNEDRDADLQIGALPLGVYVLTLLDGSGAVLDRTTVIKE